jgi:hypothetical protein
MHDWGWRIPFMLGGLIGPVGWYLRRRLPATPVARRARAPLAHVVREDGRALACGVLMMAAPSVSIYVAVFYMPSYLVHTLHRPPAISLFTSSLSGLVILVTTPLVAHFADRLASRKTLQYASLCAALLTAYPAFLALTHGAADFVALAVITAYEQRGRQFGPDARSVPDAPARGGALGDLRGRRGRVRWIFATDRRVADRPHRQSDDPRLVSARRDLRDARRVATLSGTRFRRRVRLRVTRARRRRAAGRARADARPADSCRRHGETRA